MGECKAAMVALITACTRSCEGHERAERHKDTLLFVVHTGHSFIPYLGSAQVGVAVAKLQGARQRCGG